MWYKVAKIVRSWRKNKKLAVLTPKGWLHFGDKRYSDYTAHRNERRRNAYLRRAGAIRDKRGRLTISNPYSANGWQLGEVAEGLACSVVAIAPNCGYRLPFFRND
jgi:hypothetical protein